MRMIAVGYWGLMLSFFGMSEVWSQEMQTDHPEKMQILSTAFEEGEALPVRHTCDGDNISPPLGFRNIPAQAKSLVLIHDDPDAPGGTWDHWILFNLPPTITALPENITTLPSGTKQGMNSWKKRGYGGACPPDKEHRYVFKLYALDTLLPLKEGAFKKEIEEAMERHILARATLTARYKRPFHSADKSET